MHTPHAHIQSGACVLPYFRYTLPVYLYVIHARIHLITGSKIFINFSIPFFDFCFYRGNYTAIHYSKYMEKEKGE